MFEGKRFSRATPGQSPELGQLDYEQHLLVLMLGYGATVSSGAVFGLIGGPIGVALGGMLAAMVGVPIFLIGLFFILLLRFRDAAAVFSTISGMVTGAVSITLLAGWNLDLTTLFLVAVTATVGGTAAGLASWSLRWCFLNQNDRLRKLGCEIDAEVDNEIDRLWDTLCELVDPESLGLWFQTPNDSLDGLKPVEVIDRGEIDRLWEMVFELQTARIV